jgi:hypothetical protein
MSKEGFWQVLYQGAEGAGAAALVFDSGSVAGSDATGGIFDGIYWPEPGTNRLAFEAGWTATVEGLRLVQGGPPVPAGWSFRIAGALPPDMARETSIMVRTDYGVVAARLKKIRSFPQGA